MASLIYHVILGEMSNDAHIALYYQYIGGKYAAIVIF